MSRMAVWVATAVGLMAAGCAHGPSFDGVYRLDEAFFMQTIGLGGKAPSGTAAGAAQTNSPSGSALELNIHQGTVFRVSRLDGSETVEQVGRIVKQEAEFALVEIGDPLRGLRHPIYLDPDGYLWQGPSLRFLKVSDSGEDLSSKVPRAGGHVDPGSGAAASGGDASAPPGVVRKGVFGSKSSSTNTPRRAVQGPAELDGAPPGPTDRP